MNTFRIPILLLFIYCSLSGCATWVEFDSLKHEVNQIQKDVNEQKNTSTELRKDLAEMRDSTSRSIEEHGKLMEKAATLITPDELNAMRESQAETQTRLSDLSKELQLLTGRFDENRYFIEKSFRDSASELELFKAQISGMETQIKDIRTKLVSMEDSVKQHKTSTVEQTEESVQKAADTPKDKTSIYESAYSSFENKYYKEARGKFEAFLKEYPKDDLSDNAQFWIAETHYGEKNFEDAILAYETLLKNYPQSDKIPAAMRKQGAAFIALGDKKTGKVILEQLIEKYPNAKDAGEARKKLEEMEKPAKPSKKGRK